METKQEQITKLKDDGYMVWGKKTTIQPSECEVQMYAKQLQKAVGDITYPYTAEEADRLLQESKQ